MKAAIAVFQTQNEVDELRDDSDGVIKKVLKLSYVIDLLSPYLYIYI